MWMHKAESTHLVIYLMSFCQHSVMRQKCNEILLDNSMLKYPSALKSERWQAPMKSERWQAPIETKMEITNRHSERL